MTDFTINIKVTPVRIQLDVTPAMAALLTAVLHGKGAAVYGGQDYSCTTSQKTEDAAPQTTDQPKEETKKQSEAKAEEEPSAPCTPKAPQPKEEKPQGLTAEDVRAAMHRTRQRIEGEDYKDHTDSELYKKYHKELTRQFKNAAALLGADKPSALPEEKRKAFIEQCDALKVLEDGTIGEDVPF